MCQKISTLPYEILDSRIDLPLGFYIGLASAESEPQPGGYVGLELSQAMRRFGSRVTVIEVGPQLSSREDRDVGAALLELFHDEGIEVLLGNCYLAGRGAFRREDLPLVIIVVDLTRDAVTVRDKMLVASALALSAEKRVKRLPVVNA